MKKEDLEDGEWYLCHSNHFPERTMAMHYQCNRFSTIIDDGGLNVGVTFKYEVLTVMHKMIKDPRQVPRRAFNSNNLTPETADGHVITEKQALINKDLEIAHLKALLEQANDCLLYTSPSPRDS